MSEDLRRLAARASADPFFLGWAIAVYQRRHGLDDEALARELGCVPDVLVVLRLCRRPGTSGPYRSFEQDVEDVVSRFAVDEATLRRILSAAHDA
jgi:hypothetical protein